MLILQHTTTNLITIMIINSNNPCNLNANEAEHAIALSSGVIKLICGVANSVAELVCLNAYDEIKKHPKFRHLGKHCFNNAMKGFKTYKANLVNPS